MKEILKKLWKDYKLKFIGLLLCFFLDIFCSLLLYASTNDWNASDWAPNYFFQNLLSFKTKSSDVVFLVLLRITLLPLFSYAAIYIKKSPKQKEPKKHDIEEEEENLSQDSVSVSLIEKTSKEEDSKGSNNSNEKKIINEDAEEFRIRRNRTFLRVLIFLFLVGCEIHTGIKCVVFRFDFNLTFSAIMMASSVAWINGQLWLLQLLIDELTGEHKTFSQHRHPLTFQTNIGGHICDVCRTRISKEAWSCRPCNWDMCLNCAKKNENNVEGMIRTDKGVLAEKEISNWMYIKLGIKMAKPHSALLLVAVLFLFLTTGISLILPNYQGKILDNVIQRDVESFKRDILLYVIFNVCVGLFGGIRNLCFGIVGRKMETLVRDQLYESILKQDIAFFDGTTVGDLTSRLYGNTSSMLLPIRSMLSTFVSSSILLIGGLIMIMVTSWRLSILALTTVGPIMLILHSYSKWSREVNRAIYAALSDASSHATQAFTNIRTVRAFCTEAQELAKYKVSTKDALQRGIKDAIAEAGSFAITQYYDLAVGVLLLWYGGSVVLEDQNILTVGNLITFQLYWGMINSNYSTLTSTLNSFIRAAGAAQRVMSLMDCEPAIDPNAGEKITEVQGDIQVKDVEFSYQMRPDQKVLKGINLNIKSGQVCALVGRSGGGKSTIVHLLLRFYDPKKGRIFLDGKPLDFLNPASFRKHIGIVSQETQLFSATVEENICYGMENYTKEELIAATKLANAHDFISSFEEGYQTKIGERGIRLSGGQKQRIALARVFLRNPKILLLDEATSSLDAESEALVQNAIDKLIKQRKSTVILVAHRLSTVINSDIIAVLDNGQFVEQGTHNQLVEKGGVYAKLVEKQMIKFQNSLDVTNITNDNNDIIDKLLDEEKKPGTTIQQSQGSQRQKFGMRRFQN